MLHLNYLKGEMGTICLSNLFKWLSCLSVQTWWHIPCPGFLYSSVLHTWSCSYFWVSIFVNSISTLSRQTKIKTLSPMITFIFPLNESIEIVEFKAWFFKVNGWWILLGCFLLFSLPLQKRSWDHFYERNYGLWIGQLILLTKTDCHRLEWSN